MVDDVYIVEAPNVSAELSLSRMLTPDVGFRSIHATWANLPIHEISKRNRTLVVTVAPPLPSAALQGLRALPRSHARILTLAAVPVGLNSDMLQEFRDLAGDLIFLPVRKEELVARLQCLLRTEGQETAVASGKLTEEFALQQMVGTAPQFSGLLQLIARFGPTEAPVLLTGETGTGKELCARSLHVLSRRQRGPFIPVDCGAVPEHLAESELFGHVRGAFTDAHRDHHGLIALADGGTVAFWTKSTRFRCLHKASCCACCKKARIVRWAASALPMRMLECWRRPTVIWRVWSLRSSFGATCIFVLTYSVFHCHRSASAILIFRSWLRIFSSD